MIIVNSYWEYKGRGEELKVPHYTSAAAVYDGNLPHYNGNMPPIKATCLIQLPLTFIPNTSNSSFIVTIYIQLTQSSVIL